MADAVSGPIVVVGAGQAGMQLALSMRQLGSRAPITLIGDEAYPPYERPPLSKAFLAGELEESRLYFRKPQAYVENGIDLRLGTRVTALDRAAGTLAVDGGGLVPYAACVLATGSGARPLPVPGADLAGVVTLRSLDDAKDLRQRIASGGRVVVVGAGYIGMEIAASLTKIGAKVTVVEALPRIMRRGVAAVIATHVAAIHRAKGVEILTDAGVEAILGDVGVRAVRLKGGRELACDLVVVGIGALVDDSLARDAGLVCDGGVVTDACGRTADPRIFAIGDVAVQEHAFLGRRIRLESVQNATDQAKAVARTLATGKATPMVEVPWFWTQQFDMMIQMVGVAADDLHWVVRGDPAAGAFTAFGLDAGRIAAVQAVNRGADYALGRRLVRARAEVDPAVLADVGTDLKALVARNR